MSNDDDGEQKLPRSLDNQSLRLGSWGGVRALNFVNGGSVVIELGTLEVRRLLRGLLEIEENSLASDVGAMNALKTLIRKYDYIADGEDDARWFEIEATVPIAAIGARLEPILDPDDPITRDFERAMRRRLRLERELESGPKPGSGGAEGEPPAVPPGGNENEPC